MSIWSSIVNFFKSLFGGGTTTTTTTKIPVTTTTTTTKPPVTTTTTTTVNSNGNVPPFTKDTDVSQYVTLPRNYNGRLCKPNEFHGTVTGFSDSTEATNWRYGFRGYMEWYADGSYGHGVATGYSVQGELNIFVDGTKVSWWV